MDRFGVYLAHQKTRDGKGLRRNTVGQYFRQTKLWLFSRFPQQAQLADGAILAKGRTLERFSGMRPGGKIVKQAAACKKQDLASLMSYLYSTATVAADYQDAALLSLLWYLFGRASDLAMLEKQSLSICADNVIFLRFLRMKTSEEQGLSIFPDVSPVTCPLTSLAVALALQSAPSSSLLPHLPQPVPSDFAIHGPLVPLSAVLNGAAAGRSLLDEVVTEEEDEEGDTTATASQAAKPKPAPAAPGIHAYVNRVLARISERAGLNTSLSSHSFRRGGAQHANGKAGISPHWIADRGGWNMTSTNKLFTYIFNTTEEDQKIAKILSGHDACEPLPVLDLSCFDATTQSKVRALKHDLFACCTGLQDPLLNVSPAVTDVLCAYLLKALPRFRSLNVNSILIQRVEHAMAAVGIGLEEAIAWSVHLANEATREKIKQGTPDAQHLAMIEHQAAVIDQLIDLSKAMSERIRDIEKEVGVKQTRTEPDMPKKRQQEETQEPPPKRRKRQNNHLWEAWYEWYALDAHSKAVDKNWKSTMRRCVAFMLLFADELTLDTSAPDFRDNVLAAGHFLAARLKAYCAARSITAASPGTVEKHFRALHKAGDLDGMIADFDARVRSGLVVDLTPKHERAILKPVRKT